MDAFHIDLAYELDRSITSDTYDANDAILVFNNAIRRVVNKFAPVETKTRTLRPKHQWYNNEIHEARRQRRRLELILKKHNNEISIVSAIFLITNMSST